MKKSFTLIELIFVITIIGLLAAVAVPRFLSTEVSASKANFKSSIASAQTAIDNLHGEWVANDDFEWNPGADGQNHTNDWNNTTGYPKKIDDGQDTNDTFSYILRKPLNSCNVKYKDSTKYTDCFEEYDNNAYKYYFSPKDYVEVNYSQADGLFKCVGGGGGLDINACKNILR